MASVFVLSSTPPAVAHAGEKRVIDTFLQPA
jgi:hypothetical protein